MITNKTGRRFREMQCNPKQMTKKNKTCFDVTTLKWLAQQWNQQHPSQYINLETNPSIIWDQLRDHMADRCSDEMCWIDHLIHSDSDRSKMKHENFRPVAPSSWASNKNQWLTTKDIEKVLVQYNATYPEFEFLGPSPINFDERNDDMCITPKLCEFELSNMMRQGKKKIGMVFNLDRHDQEGSHWVSMFLDLEKKFIFYFDSCGDTPPKEIKKLMGRISVQAKEVGVDGLKVYVNKIQHQLGDTECGVYALYFVITLLSGHKTPDYFMSKRIPDMVMEYYRTIYFNKI
jgi:hypothetical protein